ncbi:MAG: HAMP domain-containing histidine kinase [Candidatus Eremiobacteraeota bacterium]|nr:HAMP domain-containing histidine kinase [Candidatus Eremiobacteraeota bacterium]
MKSISSRLAALYAVLLGAIVLLVIIVSSIALVYELSGFTGDIVVAKHEEARILTEQAKLRGETLAKAAPEIAEALSGIGLRVSIFDQKGKFLGGDPTLRPRLLDKIIKGQGKIVLTPPSGSIQTTGVVLEPIPGTKSLPGRRIVLHERVIQHSGLVRPDPFGLTAVSGGYVAFRPSLAIILVALIPYWKIIVTIAIVAIALSWFIGRYFARQALLPLNEVSKSLQALAKGDYTQRRFVMVGGDEMMLLTNAFNDAAANVALAIDERKQTEDRMRQFVADAGHELRTPLTVIAGYIDVLRRGAIAEPTVAKQILSTMAIEKEHMRSLIDRLMRLARLDSEAPPRKDPIDVAELLRAQTDAARRLDDSTEISYSTQGVGTILGDRVELGEALWNIVENAMKYAPGAALHLRAFEENEKTILSVHDDGPGMSEPQRLRAFERFYRGDERGEIAGTGLGLAIARRAVERAGGTITLDSALGRGTTVTITL